MLSTITSKGQITIPVDVRRATGLDVGMQVEFIVNARKRVELVPRHGDIRALRGVVPAPGQPVSFTIKNLGDWSGGTVPRIVPGQRVWVDGPYGVFTADREQGPGYVLIGGGAGIAPLFSICQTFAERKDPRPVYLFFGGHDLERLTFRDQLEALRQRMDLHVVHVLENPPAGWEGEQGYVTTAMLRRHLPEQYRRFQFFVCGPDAMVESMERILPSIGVTAERIQTERFGIV